MTHIPNRSRRSVAALMAFVLLTLLLGGCSGGKQKYSHEFLGTFDTMIQIVGYADDEASFDAMATAAQARFETLNRLYDIYNDYEGIINVRSINEQAGIAPVKVDADLMGLIRFSLQWHEKTSGMCNIAMGPVLALWHDARDAGLDDPANAALPDPAALQAAVERTDVGKVIIDEAAGTVFLQEAGMSLDVGAVAKGYACGLVAQELKAQGYTSFCISGGGNVVTVGAPQDGQRTHWGVGIQNPDGNPMDAEETPIDVAFVNDAAVVTSGDYQRTYEVDGVSYHHLIDPATLMPATHYRAVTVMAADSGVADFMSTTLFLTPPDQIIKAAADAGVEALWILPDGTVGTTDGMKAVLRDRGGATNK